LISRIGESANSIPIVATNRIIAMQTLGKSTLPRASPNPKCLPNPFHISNPAGMVTIPNSHNIQIGVPL
jgi:hypothetical protein